MTSEKDHAKEKHSDCAKVQFDYYYGNILLTPGAGHMEKNLLLALFWTCSPIFIKNVADKLGYLLHNLGPPKSSLLTVVITI